MNALLADLERRDEALAAREREVRDVGEDLRTRAERVAERERAARERERELERTSRQEARKYLLEARAEIERTIAELKAAGADAIEETARASRQRAERMAAEQGSALERLEARRRAAAQADAKRGEREPPAVGDMVEVGTLGGRLGRLLDVRDGEGVVAVGALKMTVPLVTLSRSARQPAATPQVALVADVPDVDAPTEIDVRGMRVGEVDDYVMQALDAAVRADLKELRIIHGKGTGALRERVGEMLRKDTRVADFRLGAWNEGGTGVTVAALR